MNRRTSLDENGRERGGSTPCSAGSREATAVLPHEPPARHHDVLSVADAVLYLHLDQCTPNAAAGRELLNRIVRDGRIRPFQWGKTRLFHRAQLDRFVLDELSKPYVETARAKGLPEWKVVLKYPVRLALNPFISTAGWQLPQLFSGSLIVATVLSLPTIGPLLLRSLFGQDMFLAGSIILILTVLTMIGTLVSDIILAAVDPRIRMGAA